MDIIDLITDPALLGPYFQGSSWDRWAAVSKATYALPRPEREIKLFHEVAGDRAPPSHPVSEVVIAAGRGAGKDAISSAFGTYEAINLDPAWLRPGERGTVMIIANSKDQASISAAYLAAYFERVPLLAQMVERISADEVLLKNGAEIIVIPNSLRAPRCRRIICAIFNEVG